MQSIRTTASTASYMERLKATTSQPDPLARPHKDAAPVGRALYPTTEPEALGPALAAFARLCAHDAEADDFNNHETARLHSLSDDDLNAEREENDNRGRAHYS